MGTLATIFELAAEVIDEVRERRRSRTTYEGAIRAAYERGYRAGAGLEGGPGKGSELGKAARAEWDAEQVESRRRDEELRAKMRGDPPK
jgi:hypothetical protein